MLVTAIGALAGGAAGEIGRQAWLSLVGLVKKAFGRESAATSELDRLAADPATPENAERLAELLLTYAHDNPSFAADLRAWVTAMTRDGVTNTVTGNAQIHGPVVQGRDFTGPITFGSPG